MTQNILESGFLKFRREQRLWVKYSSFKNFVPMNRIISCHNPETENISSAVGSNAAAADSS
jgi:hypothetical protein